MKLTLASGSPRRADLLRQVGIPFRVEAADVDERTPATWAPERRVLEAARRKAVAVAADGWVLGADTVGVDATGRVLGKPRDAAEAVDVLLRLQDTTHRVLTGVCVVRRGDGARFEDVAETRVTFAPISQAQAEAYVATGEPLGKAGAYAIQGIGGALVRRIEGEYSNVVGIPLRKTVELLAEAGFPLPAALSPEGPSGSPE